MRFPDLPEGTVTFLFTDIEGSTQLLSQLRERYAALLADQRRLLREAFSHWGGQEVDTQGDALFVAFPRATQAVSAAVEIQRALATHQWPADVEVRVRMGLHTGEPLKAEVGYVGMDVHRAARLAHVGHGGQVLLSETTAALVRGELPEGVELLDLGRHRLKDIHDPEHIRQLVVPGLSIEFPPLKSLEILPPAISLDAGTFRLPAFLEKAGVESPTPLFVGRERQLALMGGFLDRALAGRGSLLLVTGGPGRGKTALLEAFSQQAMAAHPDLIVASGRCNAYTGLGDPYLPFREVLGDITGDVGAKWDAGAISSDQARRLWGLCPLTAQAIMDHGPDLLGVFIPGGELLSRISVVVPDQRGLLAAMRALVERAHVAPGGMEQRALFEQYGKVLSELAAQKPLLLLLDDLQWADSASLSLLFHLGRSLTSERILIIAAYRPVEVLIGRGESQHPLESMLGEFKRQFGQVWIDLGEVPQTEGYQFLEALLDCEPNHLDSGFRQALFSHTGGHALFSVELLRDLRERGDLIRDEAGYWLAQPALEWEILPARVEGVIESRLARLEPDSLEVLRIASLMGEEFIAEIVAQIRDLECQTLVTLLSRDLDKKHRLVRLQSVGKVNGRRLSAYRFRHNLFQKYLYNSLDKGQQAYLHEEIAGVLESFYENQAGDIAAELAWHFQEAGLTAKAIDYLSLAGVKAAGASANAEAVAHFKRGLELLESLPDNDGRTQQEFTLLTGLMLPLITLKGYGDLEVGRAIQRALDLGKQLGNPPQLFLPVLALGAFYGAQADYQKSMQVWNELLALAERVGDPALMALSHWLGWVPLMLGEPENAYRHLRHVIEGIVLAKHRDLATVYGVDPTSTCRLWASWALWLLGYPDQALSMLQAALAQADALEHPHTQAFVLALGGYLLRWLQEYELLELWSRSAIKISKELGNSKFVGDGLVNLGLVLVRQGQVQQGIHQVEAGISMILEGDNRIEYSANLVALASIHLELGEFEGGLAIVEQAFAWIESSGERFMEAELKRLQGEFLLGLGEDAEQVERCFQAAIQIARRQSAKSLELRTATSLACLLHRQGRSAEARLKLAEVYNWFAEGLETPDLLAARLLLAEMSAS